VQTNGLQVLLLADRDAAALIEECILTSLPTTIVTVLAAASLAVRRIPPADCAVVDSSFGEQSGIDALRALRAAGFEGSAVLLVEDSVPAITARAKALGAPRSVLRSEAATELAPAILAATGKDESSIAMRELRRMERLVAAGEIATGLQHDLNNPLAALLAEAQLLESEPLGDDQRVAVRRMIELCRRVIGTVRRLDVVAKLPSGHEVR
jgi:signal transduction histidine kinase